MAKKLVKYDELSVPDALSCAFDTFDELNEELQSWYDNLHENFQNGDKGDALNTAMDALQNCQSVDLPDCLDLADNPYRVSAYPLKRRASRAGRRDYAVACLNGVADFAGEKLEELQTQLKEADAEGEAYAGIESKISDIEAFIDEVQQAIDEAEGVEFPGMFG